jgi:hypothetical protein
MSVEQALAAKRISNGVAKTRRKALIGKFADTEAAE